jgi:predicted Rossmann-fold nucleotide-binding protein
LDSVVQTMPSVGVFCGCRPGAHVDYTVAAEKLGTQLAARKLTLVYGGGTVGLMGSVTKLPHKPEPHTLMLHVSMQIARTVLSKGGSVKGWIPKFLMPAELSGEMVGDTAVTETMSERKANIFEASDA